ncbi:hypothetical protein [Saccharothrix sp. NRRL B-16348]|uniref:hypothetical protein n=1 Tax=Saccharothrix sp. NRRL B-16348 TaxID=1415542 RepID=UPI0006AEB5D7|nr:hypothetical protein [Saccharothrix sp. NRRL B-16348]
MRKLRVADVVVAGLTAVILVVGAFVVFGQDAVPTHQNHVAATVTSAASGAGRTDSSDGYRLEPVEVPDRRGADLPVAFRIIGPDQRPATGFQLNMTKQLHFFVVRDDLSVYLHVHPEPDGDIWRTAVSLPGDGNYRMYAEFIPPSTARHPEPVVLGAPFEIPGDATKASLPTPSTETTTESGYRVAVQGGLTLPPSAPAKIRLAISEPGGARVESLEPHLGAYGHITAFHTEQLSTTHLHPVEMVGIPVLQGTLTFDVWFPKVGAHRLFLEFRHNGQLHTAALTFTVTDV